MRKLLKGGSNVTENMRFNYSPAVPGSEHQGVYTYNIRPNPFTEMHRKNTQSFSFSNTDNDGISTSLNFNVSDAGMEALKRIAGVEKAEVAIKDLSLAYQFSTGKITVIFSLENAGGVNVELKNTEGKMFWSDKTVGTNFSKNFEMPANGVYYLEVKQGSKVGLKRILKEE